MHPRNMKWHRSNYFKIINLILYRKRLSFSNILFSQTLYLSERRRKISRVTRFFIIKFYVMYRFLVLNIDQKLSNVKFRSSKKYDNYNQINKTVVDAIVIANFTLNLYYSNNKYATIA